jgi:putative CocE/NonD family hydrolase
LCRTPYREEVLGWKRLGVYRYVEDGYGLAFQLVRGTGTSEGRFGFNAPHDRDDGYDTVEWIASQPWCDGNVGMDGASYLAMTQLTTAAAQPPHLRCIAPHVVSADWFREPPYFGGGFCRTHTLTWTHLIQASTPDELSGGFGNVLPLLSKPQWLHRLLSRPAQSAADDLLTGDKLAHYRDVLDHPSYDDWWRQRTIRPEDYVGMGLPALVVSGNFDLGVGSLTLWRRLEQHAPNPQHRHLIIGPWDHSGSYTGATSLRHPYQLGADGAFDPYQWRRAFYDLHLRGVGAGVPFAGRVHLFITGRNQWRHFDRYPPAEVGQQSWGLAGDGKANTERGDGRLVPVPSSGAADRVDVDPAFPVVPVMAHAYETPLDLRELAANNNVLAYRGPALADRIILLGEPVLQLSVAYDVPDGDVAVWLAERTRDGQLTQLAVGLLRLSYRNGPERPAPLDPDEPVLIEIPLTYIGHELPAGSRLVLLVGASMFPLVDPNTHTGDPVRTARKTRRARMTIYHDARHPSVLHLPILPTPD